MVEETILLSKIIKSGYSKQRASEAKTISIIKKFQNEELVGNDDNSNAVVVEEQQRNKETAATVELEQKIEEKKLEAEAIIKKAQEEAEKIQRQIHEQLQNAEQEQMQLFEQAKQSGFDEGYSQGQKEGLQSYNEFIEQAKNIVSMSEVQFNQQIEEAEPLIVELGVALANRIIGTELSEDHEKWNSMLRQVMGEVREHEHIKIYVHPDWYELTVQQKDELEQLLSHCEHLYIYPDAGLMKHGCVIETKHGRIDASVDRQLNELKAQLLAKLKEDVR